MTTTQPVEIPPLTPRQEFLLRLAVERCLEGVPLSPDQRVRVQAYLLGGYAAVSRRWMHRYGRGEPFYFHAAEALLRAGSRPRLAFPTQERAPNVAFRVRYDVGTVERCDDADPGREPDAPGLRWTPLVALAAFSQPDA